MSDIFDRSISFTCVTAGIFWITGLALIMFNLCDVSPTGDLGIFCTCVGGVLTIRHYVSALHQREVQAFEIGRKAGALRAVQK